MNPEREVPDFLNPDAVRMAFASLNKSDRKDRAFAGHFVLGKGEAPLTFPWPKTSLGEEYVLSAHTDVSVTCRETEHMTLCVIGEIVMWRDPTARNAQVLEWLTDGATSAAQIIERSADVAGRWVAFVFSEDETIVFHDAWGSFGVYYGFDANDQFWISSSPKLISWSDLDRLDHDVVSQIVPSVVSDGSGGQYPYDVTPYLNIRALLPNHLLDLQEKSAKRYWPSRPLTQSQQDNPVEAAATQFSNIVKAFSVRQPLIFGLTGGTDARILTAAGEHVGCDYKSFTAISDGLTDDEKHFYIQIAEKIAAALGRENEIVYSSEQTAADAQPLFVACSTKPHLNSQRKASALLLWNTRSDYFFILGAARLVVGFGISRMEMTRCCGTFWGVPDIKATRTHVALRDLGSLI